MRFYHKMLLFLFLWIYPSAGAQEITASDFRKNHIYAEFFPLNRDEGLGPFALSFERRHYKKRIRALRVGIYPSFSEEFLMVPITYSRISNPGEKLQMEVGLGLTWVFGWYTYENRTRLYSEAPFLFFPLMLRHESENGITVRGGINIIAGMAMLAHPSVGVGYTF